MFARQGYGAVSMRTLAGELGVSTGTLYHYFPGKLALFEALVAHRVALDVAEATTGLQGATSEQRLDQLAAFVARSEARLTDTLSIALEHARHEPGSELLSGILEAYRAPLVAALGPLGGEPALSLLLGVLTQRLLGGAPDLDAHLDALPLLADSRAPRT